MKQPEIVKLSNEEKQALIAKVKQSLSDSRDKDIVVEALDFCNNLLEELKNSKLSISRLKQLLGFRSEQLKKYSQMQ